jgi:hypothetical protein
MAQHTVVVRPDGSVNMQSVKAKRPNSGTGTQGDEVQWNGATTYWIVFPGDSPFAGNSFQVGSGFHSVQENARTGRHNYDVRTSAGVLLADPDVDVE